MKNTTLLKLKKDQVFQLSLSYDASYDFCFLYYDNHMKIFYSHPPVPVDPSII